MTEKITCAFVLCAGEGTRLKPLTDHVPKCLLPINNKPMVFHVIEALRAAGIHRFVVNLFSHAALVEKTLTDYASAEKIEIRFSRETGRAARGVAGCQPVPLGTGGALLHARPLLAEPLAPGPAGFLLVNCDFISAGFPFAELIASRKHKVVLAARKMKPGEPFNPIGVTDGRLVRVEKCFGRGGLDHVFLGAHVIDTALLNYLITDKSVFSIFEGLYKPAFLQGEVIDVFVTEPASHLDLGTMDGYLQANRSSNG